MTKITIEKMIAEGIRYVVSKKQTYLYIDDVKEKYPRTKFDVGKIESFDVDGTEVKAILHKHIEDMTEFDEKIMKSLMFNPKEK